MVAKDDLDMETLQAQIDMTMSFAHNLVTSWIKPTHLAHLRSSAVNATQILEEELRQPPRLGVGASIPMAPLAHEASKLKRRLGKSGAKNEDVVKPPPQDSSKLDGEEHKGRPAKRKTKVDPFGHEGHKKKRKADSEANPYLSVESLSKHLVSPLHNSTLGESQKHNPSSEKESRRSCVTEEQRSATLTSSLPVRLPVQNTFSSSPIGITVPSLSRPPRETYATPESSRIYTDPMPTPDKANPLGISLLNLDGPPKLTDKPGNTSDVNNSRRKRKRRKKKKTPTIASTGDNSY